MRHADAPSTQGGGPGVWRSSHLYERTGSFESFGLDVVFHERCKMTKQPNHKLEILRTGEKTLKEIRDLTRRCFHIEEDSLGIIRADLTADVEAVPVQWFRDHTIVDCKRTIRELGTIPQSDYMTVGKGIAETLYAGVKPNQIRIYNKTGERLARLQSNNRKTANLNKKNLLSAATEEEILLWAADHPGEKKPASESVVVMPTTFEQMYGYDPKRIFTRVERQINGKQLEKIGLVKLHDFERSHQLEPFEKIRFINDKAVLLVRGDWGFEDWECGTNLQRDAREHGLSALRRRIYADVGNKHFYDVWNKFLPFIQNGDRLCTYKRLQAEYVSSCHAQLAA